MSNRRGGKMPLLDHIREFRSRLIKSSFAVVLGAAIGWFLYDDYKKAGFFMLPTGNRDTATALQTILYCVWLLVASMLPCLGYTGRLFISPIAAVIVFLLGLWMIFYAVKLYQERTSKAARTLMLVSVSYISLLQLVYIMDKFLR